MKLFDVRIGVKDMKVVAPNAIVALNLAKQHWIECLDGIDAGKGKDVDDNVRKVREACRIDIVDGLTI